MKLEACLQAAELEWDPKSPVSHVCWRPLALVSPNEARKRRPRLQSKVMAKRSFGARLLSLPVASVLP